MLTNISYMKQKVVGASIIGIVVILLGGGAVFYLTKQPKPANVMADTIVQMTNQDNIQSAKLDAEMEGEYAEASNAESETTDNKSLTAFSSSVKGFYDIIESEQPEMSFTVNVDTDNKSLKKAKVKTKLKNDTLYFKLSQISTDNTIVSFFPTGRWFKVDTQNFSDQIPQQSAVLNTVRNAQKIASQTQRVGDTFSRLNASILTQTERQKVKQAFLDNQFIEITNVFSPEEVKGEKSYHYAYSLNKETYISFLKELKSLDDTKDVLSENQIQDTKEEMKSLKYLRGEMWVDVNNRYVRKVSFETEENSQSGTNVETLSSTIVMDQYNKDFNVDAPDSAQSITQLFKTFSNMSSNGNESSTNLNF